MTDTIEQAVLARALRMLDSLGAQYAVVYDGQTHGTLELAPPPEERNKRRERYPRGLTRAHYMPYLNTLVPGETISIPCGDFDVRVLQGNISAACYSKWGIGSVILRRAPDATGLNVYRIY
jgi:hypothetical protein